MAAPGIVVKLAIDNRVLSLSRREADIALRPIRPKESDLWGRKLSRIAWALYANASYLAANGGPLSTARNVDRHALIGWEKPASSIAAADWLSQAAPLEAFGYRTNSLVNQLVAAKAGIGLALLPCYLGDSEAGVARAVPEPVAELSGELWIVSHADLKGTARVKAFFDLVGGGLARERELFEGAATPMQWAALSLPNVLEMAKFRSVPTYMIVLPMSGALSSGRGWSGWHR